MPPAGMFSVTVTHSDKKKQKSRRSAGGDVNELFPEDGICMQWSTYRRVVGVDILVVVVVL